MHREYKDIECCCKSQLEHAELYDEYVQEQKVPWARCGVQQQLVAHYQESIAKQNAAKAINLTYSYMLGILKKVSTVVEVARQLTHIAFVRDRTLCITIPY